MTLVLECRSDSSLPIEVDGILPERLSGLSTKQISALKIWRGRQQIELGELFHVIGSTDDQTIVWNGNLNSVHWIGARLAGGTMILESPAGRHVGSQMSGGSITAHADVSDFVGIEMTGGTIRVRGNAGDCVGGNYPGSIYGMNRGAILIDGNAGRGVGQSMRRGTIAVGGSVDRLCGWNMLAGSIFVFGECGAEFGAGMTRGTIVLATTPSHSILPTFERGGQYESSLFPMMSRWLLKSGFSPAARLTEIDFQLFHGDMLRGGRGEVFIA